MSRADNPCAVCSRPSTGHGWICTRCEGHITRTLRSVPELMDDLAITLTKQAKVVDYSTSAPSASDGKPLAFSLAASCAKEQLVKLLTSWVKYVHDERTHLVLLGHREVDGKMAPVRGLANTRVTCDETATSMSGWLLQYVDWMARREIVLEFRDELLEAVRDVQQVIDARTKKEYVGRCGFQWQGVVCTGELWAAADEQTVVCPICDTVYDTAARRESALNGVMDRVESPEVIARALGRHGVNINAERIYNWKKRGKLQPVAYDRTTRRARYRMGDVLELWEQGQRSPHNSSRRKDEQ